MLRMEEAIQIIRKMWTEEPADSFNGKYYQINNAYCNPKPIQKPSPPILVGGDGERKTLKSVAKYADAYNLFEYAETIKRKWDILKEHCKSIGRDYNSILRTRLRPIVIDHDKKIAKKRAQQIIRMPEEQIRGFAIYGTPEDVSREIKLFEEVGIQYLIVDIDPSRDNTYN